ncbi:MAG TPA: glycosyltransferase [Gaiellaceae bacterium]|nr:glycosyltransferase [Gaiellaceae bacterium]
MADEGSRTAARIALVGTYPPTKCGIATFNASLAESLRRVEPRCEIGVVACADETPRPSRSRDVVAELQPESPASRGAAAATLDTFDVVVLQHEFGIYGREDGSAAVDLVRDVRVPVAAVFHTVLRRPTPRQQEILEGLAELADAVVVQSGAARALLLERYDIDAAKVRTIPHGAHPNLAPPVRLDDTPVVLNWGLISRDKGLEFGIEAIARLGDLPSPPRYVVCGQTHPKVLAHDGEEYRRSLVRLAESLDVRDRVEFDDGYHDTASLLARVREADVVLLPYRSRQQVVSGVLVEAIASGRPVVATRFPHAEELLAEGSGLLVPHEDAGAIADALRRLLADRPFAERAAAVARRQAREFAWESVGGRYHELVADLLEVRRPIRRLPIVPAPRFDHLLRLSDATGIFEHAKLTVPRREHGYCTDDVARALVVLMREPERSAALERLAETCLAFLERAQLPDGRFHNRLSPAGEWLDDVGPDDATGRALWAAGVAALRATDPAHRRLARALFDAAAGFRSPWPRANAYAILGGVELAAEALVERAAAGLGRPPHDPAWPWPEQRLTYANALLAEARIAAGAALGDGRLLDEGLRLLAWLAGVESAGNQFSFTPAGGWSRGEPRPGFDQQPVEAGAMAEACARAFDVTGDPAWAVRAVRAAAWFLGHNDVGLPLLDRETGGCRDGLEPDGVNLNEGAESTIALLGALQQARRVQAAARSARTSASVSMTAAPMQRSAAP